MDKKIDRADCAWPIVGGKDHTAASVFRPEALLREARRQKQLPSVSVPEICVLDPDGDVVRHIRRTVPVAPMRGGPATTPNSLRSISTASERSVLSAAPSALRSQCSLPNSFLRRAVD